MARPSPGSVSRLVLSPHLDDAAFSCGGSIHARTREGHSVLVLTVFTASPPPETELSALARSLHSRWQLDGDVTTERRREDHCALERLGAELSHGGLLEALYRTGPRGALYPDLDTLFGPPTAEDEATIDAVAQEIAGLLEGRLDPAADVLAPLGVGGHVDHRLVRRAAERAVPHGRLWLYEDFPYARHRAVLRRSLGWRPWRWLSHTEVLSEEDIAARCVASADYASQWTTAFRDRQELEQRIREYVRRRRGERLWRLRAAGHD